MPRDSGADAATASSAETATGATGSQDSLEPSGSIPAKPKGRRAGYRRVLGATTLIKMGGLALTLLTSIALARWLGAAEYGAFAFASTLVTFLAIPGAMGTERLTVRHIAAYLAQAKPELAFGSYIWGNRAVSISSTGLFLTAVAALLLWSGGWPQGSIAQASLVALFTVPVYSLTKQRQATLRGLHQVSAGLFPELLLRPALHLIFIAGAAWWIADQLDAVLATALLGLATLLAYGVGNLILKPQLRQHFSGVVPQFQSSIWLRSALPFAVMAGIYVVHQKVDIILLGWLGTPADIGIFHVVSRCTDAMLVFYNALQAGFAPSVARLHAANDRVELQKLISRSTRTVTALTAAVALVLFVGGPWILGLFGEEFTAGLSALLILAAAQLLNVALGPAGMVLNMVGGERITMYALIGSVLLNIALNLALVPAMGVTGAALATGSALVFLGVVLAVAAKRRTGISVTVFKLF